MGIIGIILIMGNAGFISSTVVTIVHACLVGIRLNQAGWDYGLPWVVGSFPSWFSRSGRTLDMLFFSSDTAWDPYPNQALLRSGPRKVERPRFRVLQVG